ncbi:hypothetical protein DYH55_20460 [Methylovirgula sp. 4M-Z18]|nr:hypothetical protein DYH55_20460 [Methylovirgula sp. 4M-Z18]
MPSKRTRKVIVPDDAETYRQRNRIERCFNGLKHFRRFATRDDRRTIHFKGLSTLPLDVACSSAAAGPGGEPRRCYS